MFYVISLHSNDQLTTGHYFYTILQERISLLPMPLSLTLQPL